MGAYHRKYYTGPWHVWSVDTAFWKESGGDDVSVILTAVFQRLSGKCVPFTRNAGFPDNFETHGMVSGALSSATALG